MIRALLAALMATAADPLPGAGVGVADLARDRAPLPLPVRGRHDPHADRRARLLAARAFVAADGNVYPVGPCFVPRSARFDPARRKVRG